jgi:hypothetical protein
MSEEQVWRWATPDGKQRTAAESELKEAFTKGILPVNTLVWKQGFADWKAASEVAELRASVVAGENLVAAKESVRPGKWVAQRGGAAALDVEPPSPPAYTPLPKVSQARPRAPAVSFERESSPALPHDDNDVSPQAKDVPPHTPRRETIPMGAMLGPDDPPPTPVVGTPIANRGGVTVAPAKKQPASTLIIHAGAPPAEEGTGEGEAAPIVVPSPNGEKSARAITQPPPVDHGRAQVLPVIPSPGEPLAAKPSEKSIRVAAESARENSTKPPRSPSRPDVRRKQDSKPAASDSVKLSIKSDTPSKPGIGPVHDVSEAPTREVEVPAPVSTSMILDPDATPSDASGMFAPVSTSMLLPAVDSSKDLPEELSADDLEPASVRTESLIKQAPGKSKTLPPHRATQPSHPPPIPPRGSAPEYSRDDLDAASRIGLSRPPPPDINPLSTVDSRRMPTIPPTDAPPGSSRAVPVLLATLVSAGIASGAYYIGHNAGISEGGPVPTIFAPTVVVTNAPSVSAAPAVPPKESVACRLTASARMISPSVSGAAGIEPMVVGDVFALGIATGDKDAQVMKLDPVSLAPTETAKFKGPGVLRRVVPIVGTKLAASLEIDGPVDGVSVRRTLAEGKGFVGIRGNEIVWSKDGEPVQKAFTLASTDIDALRGSAFAGNLAYVYRQAASIWVGTTKPGDVAERIAGLGAQIGAPTLASLDGAVVAAWVDRPSADSPWKIRMVRHEPGGAAPEPISFIATGGLGGACLSPFLLRASGDRVLLLWTEEGTRAGASELTHEVRAQLFDPKLAPVGSPFTVSSPDMNAGMPRASIGADGRGLVTFLVDRSRGNTKAVEASGALLSCKLTADK